MFPIKFFNKFKDIGEDVSTLHDKFVKCSTEMMFTRRYVGKDMLTQVVYNNVEEHDYINVFSIPFANQIFKSYDGGYFSVHEDNNHLVPLFQQWYLLIDSNTITLHTNVSEDSSFPIVNVLRSSGKIHEAWLNQTISLKFFDKNRSSEFIPYIYVQFLDSPKDMIGVLCTRSIQKIMIGTLPDISFDIQDYHHEIVEMVNNRVTLTKGFVRYVIGIHNSEEFQIQMTNELKFIEMILNDRLMSKYISIDEFVRINPDFNLQMEVRHIECERDGDETVSKMSSILNEFIDYQMEVVKEHTYGTETSKFIDLITIV